MALPTAAVLAAAMGPIGIGSPAFSSGSPTTTGANGTSGAGNPTASSNSHTNAHTGTNGNGSTTTNGSVTNGSTTPNMSPTASAGAASPLMVPAHLSPSRTLTVPPSTRRVVSTASPPLPWTFPSSPGLHGSGPNGSSSTAKPLHASGSATPPASLGYPPNSPHSPRHSRSLSTSPSPPPFMRATTYIPPASPPRMSPHRRLSSTSIPRLHTYTPSQTAQLYSGPEMAPLSRQNSRRSSQGGGAPGTSVPATYGRGYEDIPQLSDLEEVHPLQAQIDKLTEKCNQHELKFRSARASFEHRVLTEFPSLLQELTKLDDRAELTSARIYQSIKNARPEVQAKLDSLLEQAAEHVATIRERTTGPWRDLVESANPSADSTPEDVDAQSVVSTGSRYGGGMALRRTRSGDSRRMSRIELVSSNDDNEDHEALSLIQHWGDDVIHNLKDQISALKTQRLKEGFRRYVMLRVLVVIALILAISVVIWGWRLSISFWTPSERKPILPPGPFGPLAQSI